VLRQAGYESAVNSGHTAPQRGCVEDQPQQLRNPSLLEDT
jgi:hypothetical protein